MRNDFIFTSESVTKGHPDKLCDQISDRILDACLAGDVDSKVACEVMATKNLIIVAGEITTKAFINPESIVRSTVKDIGYDDIAKGLDYKSLSVISTLNNQSPDIAQGVVAGIGLNKGQGAGDQGLMFGYATDETDSFMPMPIYCAHMLSKALDDARKEKKIPYLRPDGKTQVSIEYKNNQPKRVHTVVMSAQHEEGVAYSVIKKDLIELAHQTLPKGLLDDNTIFHINPTGKFTIGGPAGDCGLTGRKIAVDTYGGMGRHGGGSFSGKDPSKVDRSATYMARYIAKNIVASGLVKECEVQLSFAIGYDKPISINVNTFGNNSISSSTLKDIISDRFPLTPMGIINDLKLKRPIYQKTSCYGHFGRQSSDFTWENLDKVKFFTREAAQIFGS
ncbi:MAG: methionine adenosyltransferase [SAR324 cluster bacterium]|nr:methionine adenosyltransferase [SAR324 cluster bacterium]